MRISLWPKSPPNDGEPKAGMLKSVPGRLALLGAVVALAGVYALTQMQAKHEDAKTNVEHFARRPIPGRQNVATLQVDKKLSRDVLVSRGKRMPAKPVEASVAAAPQVKLLSPAPAEVAQHLAQNGQAPKLAAKAPAPQAKAPVLSHAAAPAPQAKAPALARAAVPVGAAALVARSAKAAPSAVPVHPAPQPVKVMQAGMLATPALGLPKGGHPVKQAMNVPSDPDADFGITVPAASQYSYNPDNRRDPFQSLLRGEFEGEHGEGGQPLVDIADLKLMGVLNKGNEYFAMVEDSKQHGFSLRVGDPVLNGRVTQIDPQCLTVTLSSYGESQTVKLHLKKNNSKAGE